MAGEPRCRPGPVGGGLSGRLTLPWPAAPGGGRQGGRERLEPPPERDALVSLAREEHAVDGASPKCASWSVAGLCGWSPKDGGPVAHEPASSARS
jgi:hypothetical protein